MDGRIREAANWIATARKTIAFTGAGVSTESGIPDFRSASGLWSRYNPAEYATLGAFMADPVKVWGMLAELEGLLDTKPNPGHIAFAKLEAGGAMAGIVTQNIDGLHQAAGSRMVVEFHGSSRTYTCMTCRQSFDRETVRAMPREAGNPMPIPDPCPEAGTTGGNPCTIKPDVVFFDEAIPPAAFQGSERLVAGADLVVVAGTSCEVYPASEIPLTVRRQGGRIIEINLEPAAALRADIVLQGKFGEVAVRLHDAWEGLLA